MKIRHNTNGSVTLGSELGTITLCSKVVTSLNSVELSIIDMLLYNRSSLDKFESRVEKIAYMLKWIQAADKILTFEQKKGLT